MKSEKKDNKIWGCLLHLSFNMWEDFISPHRPFRGFRPNLELSEQLWSDAIEKMNKEGINMVVIDLGDAVKYESHPEIAVNNAWSTTRLKEELKKIRSLGMEPIPKLNFSAGHNTWMGEFSRMVSTEEYYKFCSDLIKEVSNLFDTPRLFHLGLDEETFREQVRHSHVTIRKNNAWWKDFYLLVDEVEKNSSRAWIWPDYMLWNEPEQFYEKMPKSVVQGNWYYGESHDMNHKRVKAYLELEKSKYDQILTGSHHNNNTKSIESTVLFGKEYIEDSRLLGFLQTFWRPTIEENRELIIKGIELAGEAKKLYYQ